MHFSMKFSISLLLLLCCIVYESHASVGVDIEKTDCICGRMYSPVCGSDSQTYSNPCLFECARKKMTARGRSLRLVSQSPCAGEVQGKARVAAEEKVDDVKAADEDNDLEYCACGRNLEPVCGSDNRTYNNRCLLDCKRAILARSGEVLTLLRNGACN